MLGHAYASPLGDEAVLLALCPVSRGEGRRADSVPRKESQVPLNFAASAGIQLLVPVFEPYCLSGHEHAHRVENGVDARPEEPGPIHLQSG